MFEPRNNKNLYVKVGEWNSSHPPVTPGQIWKDVVKLGCYNVPKLRISSAAMKLARNIGKQFTTSSLSVLSIDKGSDDSMSTSENVLEDEISTSSHDNTNTTVDDLPNASEYPVFHSHGLKICDDAVKSKAVHELLKYNGGNAIFYHQMSNHKGSLARIPSATSASGCAAMLNRKENFMKELTEFIGGSMNKSNGSSDAAKCTLHFFSTILKKSSKKWQRRTMYC